VVADSFIIVLQGSVFLALGLARIYPFVNVAVTHMPQTPAWHPRLQRSQSDAVDAV